MSEPSPVRIWEETTPQDLAVLREQLGRIPRGVVGVAARCPDGTPAVVVTAPRLEDGTPFPTTFYLTCPRVVHACSVLEAEKTMEELNAWLAADPQALAAHERAHDDYIARRQQLGNVPEIAGISAGGMPTRVKCLHALVGHALAVGRGINVVGDRAIDLMKERGLWAPCGEGKE